MSKRKNIGLSFVLSLFLLNASVGLVNAKNGTSTHSLSTRSLSASQEEVVVGGDHLCEFVGGLAVAMGIGSLLGCAVCAVPGVILGTAVWVTC